MNDKILLIVGAAAAWYFYSKQSTSGAVSAATPASGAAIAAREQAQKAMETHVDTSTTNKATAAPVPFTPTPETVQYVQPVVLEQKRDVITVSSPASFGGVETGQDTGTETLERGTWVNVAGKPVNLSTMNFGLF